MKHHNNGFTLVELMIVISIIGIISALAIPQYQAYIAKAQTGRIIAEVGELRLTVEDCLNEGKLVIGLAGNECDPRSTGSNLISGGSQVGIPLPANTGVAQFSNPLTTSTTITGHISGQVSPPLKTKKVLWERSTNGAWSCKSSIEHRYLPTSCVYDSSL